MNVLLLEPVGPSVPFVGRAGVGEGLPGPARVLAVVRTGSVAPDDRIEQLLGVSVVVGRTTPYVNDFPALPVRGDQAIVWFASFPDAGAAAAARRRPATEPGVAGGDVQVLDLEPTARSAYR